MTKVDDEFAPNTPLIIKITNAEGVVGEERANFQMYISRDGNRKLRVKTVDGRLILVDRENVEPAALTKDNVFGW